ncbi:MAG: FGGY family pentulose kinase [Celeribacter sp.]|jgi:FGGY-family pentulose kinase
MAELVCAVDVGTGSTRAGLFRRDGSTVARAVAPIGMSRPEPLHAEHGSEQIWSAVGRAIAEVRAVAGVGTDQIAALAFDATCSLVLRDRDGAPLGLSEPQLDTISWCDHRARAEASLCTRTGHEVLEHLGGAMSPEMQIPKLMWLKRHRPDLWSRLGRAMDLVDFLAWRATGTEIRSESALSAKWTYLPHRPGAEWCDEFLDAVGLDDLRRRAALPEQGHPPGTQVGRLGAVAAAELSLLPGTPVATGAVDAYAGALGALTGMDPATTVALIGGTSSCLMALSDKPVHAHGVWGPFRDAVLPGLWAVEGGQSATGSLLDQVIRWSGAGLRPSRASHDRIAARIATLRLRANAGRDTGPETDFAAGVHMLPDLLGNRTPFATYGAQCVISGLSGNEGFDALCRIYWRAAVSIALGARQIIDHMNSAGLRIDKIALAGGHANSLLLPQLYADATGCQVSVCPDCDMVLLGGAIMASRVAGWQPDLPSAAAAMAGKPTVCRPEPRSQAARDIDYRVFLRMQEHRLEIEAMIAADRTTEPNASPVSNAVPTAVPFTTIAPLRQD